MIDCIWLEFVYAHGLTHCMWDCRSLNLTFSWWYLLSASPSTEKEVTNPSSVASESFINHLRALGGQLTARLRATPAAGTRQLQNSPLRPNIEQKHCITATSSYYIDPCESKMVAIRCLVLPGPTDNSPKHPEVGPSRQSGTCFAPAINHNKCLRRSQVFCCDMVVLE